MKRKRSRFFWLKAQVSIFMIIAVVLLAGGVFFFYGWQEESDIGSLRGIDDIKFYISSCLDNKIRESIYLIALQGGYYHHPPDRFGYTGPNLNDSISSTYYIHGGQLSVVDHAQIEEEVSKGARDSLLMCTSNLSVLFPYATFETGSMPTIKTGVSYDIVEYTTGPGIKVKVNTETYSIGDLESGIRSNLFQLHQTALELSYSQYSNGMRTCISCVSRLANKTNLTIESYEFEDEEDYDIVYDIGKYNDSQNDLVFRFAHNFKLNNMGQLPLIESIDELDAYIDYEFAYDVASIGDDILFYDDTNLFDIGENSGIIRFTPRAEDTGVYIITITANDSKGKVDDEVFKLNVRNFGFDPKIEFIGYLYAKVNEQFSFQVKISSGAGIAFADNSEIFDIKQDGRIEFTPQVSQVGIHSFNITAIDSSGNFDVEEGYIVVNE
jgi:hypothetical protein